MQLYHRQVGFQQGSPTYVHTHKSINNVEYKEDACKSKSHAAFIFLWLNEWDSPSSVKEDDVLVEFAETTEWALITSKSRQ